MDAMKILAISGSSRRLSTNTALLNAMKEMAPEGVELIVFSGLDSLPIFSPDAEGALTPEVVCDFIKLVQECDGLIISSPEYVRAIPGGLKNAIDWMVSRFEIVDKPVALAHASHRGDDMLHSLRLVLSTVSNKFFEDHFLRIPLIGKAPGEVYELLRSSELKKDVSRFLDTYLAEIRGSSSQCID